MNSAERPLVSVVISTYNRIDTLPTALSSVLNQTYDNLELIVVDDGSEDGTKEYLEGISDERFSYSRSDVNLGPSAARNMGARLSKGEYLAFQDSDDEWMPDKLEKQMRLMLENKEFSLVYCAFAKYRNGELLGYTPSKDIPYEEKYGDIYAYLLLKPLVSTQTVVVRRDLFLEENGFNETLKSYEDYEFSLRFSKKYRIGFVDEPLVKVNSSPDGVNKRFAERIRTQFFMARETLEDLRDLGLLGSKLESILAETESLFCHDVFIEEMSRMSDQMLTREEHSFAELLLQAVEQDKTRVLFCMDILERISGAMADILRIYTQLYANKTSWSVTQQNCIECVKDIVEDCETLFPLPAQTRQSCARLYQGLETGNPQWTDQLFLLTDAVEILETLKKLIQMRGLGEQ